MRKILFLAIISIIPFVSYAQNISLRIAITNKKLEPIEFASVKVLSSDSTYIIGDISDSKGFVFLDSIKSQKVVIKINALGYIPYTHTLKLDTNKVSLLSITLKDDLKILKEVVVKQSKPLFRQEDDKLIVDASTLSEMSTNAYEILEKTPGLFIDQDGNIYIASIKPAHVLINGRELKLSREDIALMLKNIAPSNVEKIEILKSPSAKYDASSSGGILNVILKKGVKIGINGSVNSGYQQGEYSNLFVGANVNNTQAKHSFYCNANYSNHNNYQYLTTNRALSLDTILSQEAFTTYPNSTLSLNSGYSYELNNRWSISSDLRLNYSLNNSITDNKSQILINNLTKNIANTLSTIDNANNNVMIDQNFQLKAKLDSTDGEWQSNISYTYTPNRLTQNYENQWLHYIQKGNGQNINNRLNVSLKSDFNKHLKNGINFETGIKSSFVKFDNKADFYYQNGNSVVNKDFLHSNNYKYSELILSSYIQGAKSIRKFLLKTGLRLETTQMNGRQYNTIDTGFKVNSIDLFPYVYFSHKIMAIAGYDLRAYIVYRRTIARPNYDQLNPFLKYIDPFMAESGNPNLKPQFTNNYEFNISVNEHPLFAIGYNQTNNLITNVFYQNGYNGINQAVRTYDNIGQNKEFYLRGMAAVPPGRQYFGIFGGQLNYNQYDGLYQGVPMNLEGYSWLFFTYHQLKLNKKSNITLSGFWRLPGLLQVYELSAMGALNSSVNYRFIKDKLNVSLNFTDFLFTNKSTFVVRQGNVDAQGYRESDSRRIGINVTYSFGFQKTKNNTNMFENIPNN